MKEITILKLSLKDLCKATELSTKTVIEIAEEGIIEPIGSRPENWQFSVHYVAIAKKATRLHRDLSIDWPGVALAMSLIEELEQTRQENKKLRARLQHFVSTNGP